jgi:nucleoside-diphosphate-sugar epimerase
VSSVKDAAGPPWPATASAPPRRPVELGVRVVVTGASGFVGLALVRALRRRGDDVLALVRREQAIAGVQVQVVGELEHCTGLDRAFAGADAVIHLAGRAHVTSESDADPEARYRAANELATRQVATAAVAAGVGRLVFTSTIKVNGEQTAGRPFRADDEPAPVDAYARSKLAAERLLRDIARDSDLEVCVVRPPLVYGPGVRGNFERLMRLVAKGIPLPFASVDNRRSLVGLGNLCDLLVRCVASPDAAGMTFLVSDGEDLSTPALIRRLARALGRRDRVFRFPPLLLRAGMAASGLGETHSRLCGSLQVDAAATCERLGWRPPHSVEWELAETAKHFLASG